MTCKKHPQYKGFRQTKRNCEDCKKLYRSIQKKILSELDPSRPYRSLSSPIFMNLTSIVAEIATSMLYGVQDGFFWKETSPAANHYKDTLKQLYRWKQSNPQYFKTLNTIFYHTYTKFMQKKIAEEIHEKEIFTSTKEESIDRDLSHIDFELDERSKIRRKGHI